MHHSSRLLRPRLACCVIVALCFAGVLMPGPIAHAQNAKPSTDASAKGQAKTDQPTDDDLLAEGLNDALSEEGEMRTGRGRANDNNAMLSQADLPEAMAVLRDYRPELVERFEEWASRHPQQAARMLSRTVPMISRLMRMRQDDPKGYELAIRDLRYFRATTIISRELRQARLDDDQARVAELSQKLQAILSQHFDVRQQIRERDIQKLQQRLEQLRKQLDQRKNARARILEKRFDQLGNPDEKVPW